MSDNLQQPEKAATPPPKLLDQVRDRLRLKHTAFEQSRLTSVGSNDTSFSTVNVIHPKWVSRSWRPS